MRSIATLYSAVIGKSLLWTRLSAATALLLLVAVPAVHADDAKVVLHRGNSTIVLEPYAPNIVRVTLGLKEDKALAAPGYGFVAKPAAESWSHQDTDSGDEYRSSRISVTVGAEHHSSGPPPLTVVDIAKFFNGSTPGANITMQTSQGKKLLEMTGWSMSVPNYKDGNAGVLQ